MAVAAIISIALLKASVPGGVCSTLECRRYAQLLLSSVNESVKPCQSFTRFVCDGWERNNTFSVQETMFIRVLEKTTALVQVTDVPQEGQNSVQRAAQLYRSCHDVFAGKRDELADVKRSLLEAGITWPAFPGPEINLPRLLLYCSLVLGWDAVFHVTPFSAEGKTILLLNPGRAFFHVIAKWYNTKSEAEFGEYFDVLKAAFSRNENDEADFEETYVVHNLLTEDLSRTYYSPRHSFPRLLNASAYRQKASSWSSALAEFHAVEYRGFQLATAVPEYARTFLEFWKEHGERAAHYFASWCTVQVAALYANKHLIVSYHGGSIKKASAYHAAFCLSRTYVLSREALFANYNVDLVHGNVRSKAELLTRSVGDAILRRVRSWTHFSPGISAIGNWSFPTGVFDVFGDTSNATVGGVYGAEKLDMNESFGANWRKVTKLTRNEDEDEVAASICLLRLFAYFRSAKKLYVLPLALHFPIFDVGLSSVLNYAGLGGQLATAIGSLLASIYGSTAEGASAIANLSDCIAEGRLTDGVDEDVAVAESLVTGALVDAYKSDGQVEHQVPALASRYDAIQLLFMARCFAECQGSDTGNVDGLCDLSLRNVKEFAEAFSCVPGTPMNPVIRCNIP